MIESLFEEECCALAGAEGRSAQAPPPESQPRPLPAPQVAQPCVEEPRAAPPLRRRVRVVEFL